MTPLVAFVCIILLYVAPPLWIRLSLPQPRRLLWILLVGVLAGVVLSVYAGWNALALGLRTDTFSAWPAYAAVLGFGVVVVYATRKKSPPRSWWTLVWVASLISVFQEFLYRSVLIPLSLTVTSNSALVLVLNIFLFVWLHIFYSLTWFDVLLLSFAGAAFAGLYLYAPNLLLVSLVHIALNIAAVRSGRLTERKAWN